ncbi:DUF992 domain-containing protein [Algicella marina]|uniref:DUF992 domain-containing protein n=1 Tax=Algicella marina TaxID=2683284 RepID=A0A6P1T0I9_9RHOB|nr:DUF992 domain-containing protein [Algicella marina]QHQ36248.1 DUF992 domain-containing protein [Algicella marina]
MNIRNVTLSVLAGSAIAGAAIAQSETTEAEPTGKGSLEAGILTCELTGGTNFVVISEAEYSCVFDVAGTNYSEVYNAEIGKLGIDLSIENAEVLKWAVVSATGRFDEGFISGEYAGVSADAALGLGASARMLVGGIGDSITLQPVSVGGREGIGIAAGIEQMSLEFVGEAA